MALEYKYEYLGLEYMYSSVENKYEYKQIQSILLFLLLSLLNRDLSKFQVSISSRDDLKQPGFFYCVSYCNKTEYK